MVPEIEKVRVLQVQTVDKDERWMPLGTGSAGAVSASALPTVRSVSVNIRSMGLYRVTSLVIPGDGISDPFGYPSPASPDQGINIHYLLGTAADSTDIVIYNLFGDLVREMHLNRGDNGTQLAQNIVNWDCKNGSGVTVASGGYIVQITVHANGNKFKAVTKVAVIR